MDKNKEFYTSAKTIASLYDYTDELKKRLDETKTQIEKVSSKCTHHMVLYPVIYGGATHAYCFSCGHDVIISEKKKSQYLIVDFQKLLNEYNLELDGLDYNVLYSSVFGTLSRKFKSIILSNEEIDEQELLRVLEEKAREIVKNKYNEVSSLVKKKGR